jgi:hypothetical protein
MFQINTIVLANLLVILGIMILLLTLVRKINPKKKKNLKRDD